MHQRRRYSWLRHERSESRLVVSDQSGFHWNLPLNSRNSLIKKAASPSNICASSY